MELKLMQLRKAAGYKNRDDFANVLGINPLTYKGWETGRTRLKLEDACDIADILGCSLDELAGRTEYVGRFSDPQQAQLNAMYEQLEEMGKSAAIGSVRGILDQQVRDKSAEEGRTSGNNGADRRTA